MHVFVGLQKCFLEDFLGVGLQEPAVAWTFSREHSAVWIP